MASAGWSPSVVVGIDFGMTCTAVAYSSEVTHWARPEVIQRWPDKENGLFNKFPSRVAYNGQDQIVDWGRCNSSKDIHSLEREFKLYLDASFSPEGSDNLSHRMAVKFYIDYMTKLNKHIDETLGQRFALWEKRNVEYRLSIPTTWKDPRLTNQLKVWLAEAGFINTPARRVIFSQSEAEAAAIYVADHYQRGDVIMVVDAGGATTDLNVLEVTEKTPDIVRMVALDKAEGINVGAVQIDRSARYMIESELERMEMDSDMPLRWLAESMMESGFEHFKHNLDTQDGSLDHYMEIPGRPGQYLVLRSIDLRAIFDYLIDQLISYIGAKIDSLAEAYPQHQLRYIVLAGGLGSSKYVKEKLVDSFWTESTRMYPAGIQILVAEEPQLAVVKGLVMDRSQALSQGVSVYMGRCCRVSYGVLSSAAYDKDSHTGEPTQKDPLTGKVYAVDQIDWLIKEGMVVPEEGITKLCTLKLGPDQKLEPFSVHIVMSELRASALPRSRHRGTVTKICTLEGRFFIDDFQPVKKSFFGRQKDHVIASFYLKLVIGSTDLSFELVSLDGRKYNKNTAKVKVIWHEVQGPASPVQRRPVGQVLPISGIQYA